MSLIDSHCHLDAETYGAARDEVIARAQAAEISRMVLIGQWAAPRSEAESGLWSARETLSLARTNPALFSATAGVHPHDAAFATAADWAELARLCAEPDLVAVGECGLDFHYDRSPRDSQREQFEHQLKLATALNKPVVVHSREADAETAEILRAHLGPAGGVIHCFTSDWAAARAYLDLGLHISLSGVITFKSAEATRDAAARIPLDRLMVETDAPFLAPIPFRGKRNEPALVVHTARKLAEIRGVSLEEISEATSANARRALRLPS